MDRVEKTIFLSYRRTNIPWALAIFQNLTHHGFDVFFDYNGISSGDFEQVILGNIRARAHFLVLLTPSALERCREPGDWLRREIETALANRRNIVPLMLEGFAFGSPGIADQLTGALRNLKNYNGLPIPPEYFDEAMGRLRNRYLNTQLTTVLHAASASMQRVAKEQNAAAKQAPLVQKRELTAQQWFERGYVAADLEEKMRSYDESIRLNPDFGIAFNNRANTRYVIGDTRGAIEDYNEAIRVKADDADLYYNRANARYANGEVDGALEDYNEAIRLKPIDADALNNRANARNAKGDSEGALRDYNEAIRLKPDFAEAFYNRASILTNQFQHLAAVADYQKYLSLGGGLRGGDQSAVEEIISNLRQRSMINPQNSSNRDAQPNQ